MKPKQSNLKKSTGELKEGVVSLSSILNKHSDGTIYFGVKNDGEVIGQEIGDKINGNITATDYATCPE